MIRRSNLLLPLLAFFLLVLIGGDASAQNGEPEQWQAEIASLIAGDSTHPPPQRAVLFVGSPSIRLWTTLAEDFPGVPTINRGFGSSWIADSTYYADRIVVPYRPPRATRSPARRDCLSVDQAECGTPGDVAKDARGFPE